MDFPKLYSKSSKGALLEWQIFVNDNYFYTVAGQIDGQKVTSAPNLCLGKNLGKKNETSPHEQAIAEAQSKWEKKLKTDYHLNIEDVDKAKFFEPMLAKIFKDRLKKIKYPVLVDPKLNGCVSGDSNIITLEYGKISIGEIVDQQLSVNVLSYNEASGNFEYKKILNWFKNKPNSNTQWYEIQTDSGQIIRITGNHRVYLPDLGCWRTVDSLDGTENLMEFNFP